MSRIKLYGALFVGLLAAASTALISQSEFAYRTSGKTADAVILSSELFDKTDVRGRTTQHLLVRYDFTEEGGRTRSEEDKVPSNWSLPTDPNVRVPVEYIPGETGRSRLAGHHNLAGAVVIGRVSFFCFGYAVYLWRRRAQ